jgi:dolichol kinase
VTSDQKKVDLERIMHNDQQPDKGDVDMSYAMAEKGTWVFPGRESLRGELVRKFLHVSIALTPMIAEFSYFMTIILLSFGVLAYAIFEYLRCMGVRILLVSDLTVFASRKRDEGRFVLGPITLGIGALLALLLFPSPAAYLAVYALAFGDGLASLAGKAFGRIRIPFVKDKTLEGSLTCFLAVFFSCFTVSRNLVYNFIVALTATILEIIPLKDMDNILIPIGTGLVASLLFFMV